MRKAEILKIAPAVPESSERREVVVSLAVVDEAEHLIVDTFEMEELCYRTAITEHEIATYKYLNGRWSIKAAEHVQITRAYVSNESKNVLAGFHNKVMHIEGNSDIRKYGYFLEALEYHAKEEMRVAREDKVYESMYRRHDKTPDLTADFEEWVKNCIPSRMLYKNKGRYTTITCSDCGCTGKYAFKIRETYEGMFEPTIEKPASGNAARCRVCGAKGTYMAIGRIATSRIELKESYVLDALDDDIALVRFVTARKTIRPGTPATYELYETARSYFYPKRKRPQTDWHVTDWVATHWIPKNRQMCPYTLVAAELYPGSYAAMEKTCLKYSALKEYVESKNYRCRVIDYLKKYKEYPNIELPVKLGYGEYIWYDVVDLTAKTLTDFFKITKDRISQIRKSGEQVYLKKLQIFQAEKQYGVKFTEEQVRFCLATGFSAYEVLNLMSMQKFMNRVKRYQKGESTLSLSNVTYRYADYLLNAQQLGYDMTDSIKLFPNDLDRAHERMVEELYRDKQAKRDNEVNERYAHISKMYPKLYKYYGYKDDQYLIRPARMASEITAEGRTLHHCVGGDSYLNKHNTGKSFILFLRKKGQEEIPYITIEINDLRIVQWYGAYDKKPDEEIIKAWLENYINVLENKSLQIAG